jgi:hypothetical protein
MQRTRQRHVGNVMTLANHEAAVLADAAVGRHETEFSWRIHG